MLFSSMTFVFMFLPIVCTLYLISRKEFRNYILLISSIIFYAWGEPRYLMIMILTILINYFGAILLDRAKSERTRKLWLTLTVISDLAVLFYFKYFNFVMDNINTVFAMDIKFIDVILPIGISFYTFQAMSYLIDVYRHDVPAQRDLYKLALYITLFPQLVAGPIVKYHDVDEQISNREVIFDNVSYGVKRFIIGLSKKMLLANTLGAVADKIFTQQADAFGPTIAWIGAIAYSFQLFYDFSGYSDMAIGLGSIFGFKFLENFNYPYISKSITEFWRRWHISLSSWFKEYLYIPLGGNRVSKTRNIFNIFIVFLATGIWHGASWNFIVWGLWHGLFNIIEKLTGWNKKEGGKLISFTQHIYTIFIFIIGWVMFRAENLTYALNYIKNMFGLIHTEKSAYKLIYYIDTIEVIAFVVGILCAMPIFKNILTTKYKTKFRYAMVNVWIMILFLLSSAWIAASTYNPFIYFRF